MDNSRPENQPNPMKRDERIIEKLKKIPEVVDQLRRDAHVSEERRDVTFRA